MRINYYADTPTVDDIEAMSRPQLREFIAAHERNRFEVIERNGGRDYATLVDDTLTDYAIVRLHLLDCWANELPERAAMYERLADIILRRIPDDRLRHNGSHVVAADREGWRLPGDGTDPDAVEAQPVRH